MAEIPDDIMKTARTIFDALGSIRENRRFSETSSADVDIIARALLAERMAERERCARIADAEGWQGEISAGVRASWPLFEQGGKKNSRRNCRSHQGSLP
jgi:hypothetical protein